MKLYVERFRKERIIYRLLTLVVITIIVFFLCKVVENTVVGLEYPNELLEPANINFTNTILNGNIPYLRENLVSSGNIEPPINYEYPFMHNLVAAFFTVFFNGNTIVAHYFVSFMAMVGTSVIGSIIVFNNSRTTVGATAVFLFLMFCHWRYGYISASPDGFGLFVTMLSLYLACKTNVKRRALWTALGTVVAFYSKQYFAFVCVSIFIYFLFYSKKEAIKYLEWCVLFLVISIFFITWKWPLFWTYSVLLLMHGCFQGWDASGFLYVLEQMKYFAILFLGLVVVMTVSFVQKIKKQDSSINNSIKNYKNVKRITFLEGDALLLFLIQIPVQIVVLFVFGRNDGAYLTYFLQLLIPSIIISMILVIEKMNLINYENLFALAYGLMLLFITFFGLNKLPMHILTSGEISSWGRAYTLIDEYREKGDVLHTQVTAFNAMKNGDSIFGTGHDGDIRNDTYWEWKESNFQKIVFPDAGQVFAENLEYRKSILNRINEHDFAIVVIEGEGNIIVKREQLEAAGYYMVDMIPLQLGNMTYDTSFWAYE